MFWDSSAVVPLLVHQQTSALTDRWLADDPAFSLWTMTPVEITSALWRLVRDGTVQEADAQLAESRALELAAASYTVADIEAVKAGAQTGPGAHATSSRRTAAWCGAHLGGRPASGKDSSHPG
jgi:predicted nucleic acid-binding protein